MSTQTSSNSFKWTEDSKSVVRQLYETHGGRGVADIIGTTENAVYAMARRLGVKPRHRNRSPFAWTRAMLSTMRRIYETADKETLVREIGVPIHVIRSKAIRLGLKNKTQYARRGRTRSARNKNVNVHFFDLWTTDMAYVLGFLFADGSINSTRMTEVVVGLSVKDKCVVEYIRKVTKSKRPFTYRLPHVGKNGFKYTHAVFLVLGSKVIVNRLMQLGMKPRKTFTDEPFPDVPDDMMPHFVRGFFDGDGTACVTGQGYCRAGFVGSPRHITGLRDALCRLAGVCSVTIYNCNNTKTPCVKILYGARADLIKLRDFMYPSGFSFCLERKKTVLDKWLADSGTKVSVPKKE